MMYKLGDKILMVDVDEKFHRFGKELFYDPVERVFYMLFFYAIYGDNFAKESYYIVQAMSYDLSYVRRDDA